MRNAYASIPRARRGLPNMLRLRQEQNDGRMH